MASRFFRWIGLTGSRKKNSSSEKTVVGKISGRSGVELCECCRLRMRAWLAWLEERLVEWCASTPELDPAYLDRLDWTLFSSGRGAWIFRDAVGAKALSEELERNGGALVIGRYEYRITRGKDREFISRFEAKHH
jgi:hypothetical protein